MLLQKEDLARMYRLFQRIPKGLDPVADIFKKHVEAEGIKIVKEVTEAIESKKEKDAGELLTSFCFACLWTAQMLCRHCFVGAESVGIVPC